MNSIPPRILHTTINYRRMANLTLNNSYFIFALRRLPRFPAQEHITAEKTITTLNSSVEGGVRK